MKRKILGMAMIVTLASSFSEANPNLVCTDAKLENAAYGMTQSMLERFSSNMTENRNRGVSFSNRVERIKAAIDYRNPNHKFPKGHDINSIAETIAWAAECTGNDFTVLAAILSVESGYCMNLVGGGADSGCSQLSARPGASIAEMKSQLNIRGGDGDANKKMVKKSRDMILGCFDGNQSKQKAFLDFYARDYNSIKNDLRRGKSIKYDILAGAYYLKFKAARAGGYTLPGTAPGGIYQYNSGGVPNYVGKVLGTGRAEGRMRQINDVCLQDNYTPNVLEEACVSLGLESPMCHDITGIPL